MKIEEPEAMKEIHRIREKHHEETKDMTPEERSRYFKGKAESFMKRLSVQPRGLTTIKK